jgi:polar amino acid transport system substrate-binding protein
MSVFRSRALLAALLLVLATACAGSGASTAAAPAPDSRLSRIIETGVLRVGMSGEQPPLNMVARNGEMLGLDVALTNVLAAAIGVRPEIVRIPFPNLIDALESGEIDLIMSGMTITAQRNLRVVFVGPYFLSGQSLLSRSTELLAASLEALNRPSVRLTALRSSTSEMWVKRALPQATLTVTDSLEAGIQAVIANQADALVADREICYFAILRNPQAGLSTRAEPLTVEPIGIAVPPNDHQLANLIQNYLGALEMQGALQRARDYWFEDESWVDDLK